MPLYELKCLGCNHIYEEFSSYLDPSQSDEFGKCPKCQKKTYERVISKFRIGGKGDLREFTMHGCHDAHVPHSGHEAHGHDHEHEHSHSDHTHDANSVPQKDESQ